MKLGERLGKILQYTDDARNDWRRIIWRVRRKAENKNNPDGRIRFNITYAILQNLRSVLRPDRVEELAIPERDEFMDNARAAQLIVNNQFRKSRMARSAYYMIDSALTDGLSIAKVEWGGPFSRRVDRNPSGADRPFYGKASDNGHPLVDSEARESQIQEAMERIFTNYLVGRQQPHTTNLDVMDFLKDPNTNQMQDSLWTSHRCWLTRSQVKDLKRAKFFKDLPITYSNALASTQERIQNREAARSQRGSAPVAAVAAMHAGVEQPATKDDEEEWDPDGIEVWEFHDRATRKIHWVTPGMEETWRDQDDALQIKRPRYVDLSFTRRLNDFWSIPDAHKYIEAQENLDSMYDSLARHTRKNSKTVHLAQRGANKQSDLEALASASGGSVVVLDDIMGIREEALGQLPGGMVEFAGMVMRLIQLVSGETGQSLGSTSSPQATATEAGIVQSQRSSRTARMQMDVNETLAEIASLYHDFNEEFFTLEDALPILGEVDALFWQEEISPSISRKDIEGDFEFHTAIGSGSSEAEALAKKMSLDLYNYTANDPNANRKKLLEDLLRAHGKNPRLFVVSSPVLTPPTAALGGVGRSPGESGFGEPVSKDGANRTGRPQLQSLLSDAMRMGGRRV